MNIYGNGVFLRAIEEDDAELLFSMINNADIEYMLGGFSFPVSMENQKNWIRQLKNTDTVLRCIIVSKDTGNAVGTIILSDIDYKNGNAQVHIKLGDTFQGKGYGSESLKLLIKYARDELRLHLIYANINSYNIPSQKLFEKLGFIKEGVLRDRIYKRGQYNDVFVYSLLVGMRNA